MAFKLLIAAALIATCVGQQYADADYNDYQEVQHAPRAAVPRAIPHHRPLAGPAAPRPTPVAILKQINRHNDDGSYTYGFEGADGTFKIETKFTNGEVKGKYGFVDDTGKVRTVEYGADRYGFQPAGEGITVAPPTLVDETINDDPEFLDDFRPRPRPQSQRVKAARPQQQYRPAPPPPQPQYIEENYPQGGDFEQETTFHSNQYQVEEPQQEIPRRLLSTNSASPVPQRPLSIPGAAPVPQRPISIPGAAPVPQRSVSFAGASQAPSRHAQITQASFAPEPPRRAAHAPRAGPAVRPQPALFQPQPQYQAHPKSFAAGQPRGASSILDQLANDYALPQGGSPTHDYSFGSHQY